MSFMNFLRPKKSGKNQQSQTTGLFPCFSPGLKLTKDTPAECHRVSPQQRSLAVEPKSVKKRKLQETKNTNNSNVSIGPPFISSLGNSKWKANLTKVSPQDLNDLKLTKTQGYEAERHRCGIKRQMLFFFKHQATQCERSSQPEAPLKTSRPSLMLVQKCRASRRRSLDELFEKSQHDFLSICGCTAFRNRKSITFNMVDDWINQQFGLSP